MRMWKKAAFCLSILLAATQPPCSAYVEPPTNIQTLEVSLKHFHVDYKETIRSAESGWMNGMRLSYKNQDILTGQYWKILYEHTNADDHYKGAYQNGTPVESTTGNKKTTTEFILANPIDGSPGAYAYIGYGHHSWDRALKGTGGYLEKYAWHYIPVGYRNEFRVNQKWEGAFDLALRFMFNGSMKAMDVPRTTTQNYDEANFKLGSRVGLKLELPYTYHMTNQLSLSISPWYEYWGIKESGTYNMRVNGVPTGDYFLEPSSHTNQYGVDLGLMFKF